MKSSVVHSVTVVTEEEVRLWLCGGGGGKS